MFGSRPWRVGRIFGIELRIDSSWFVIALLVVYSFYIQFRFSFAAMDRGPATALAVLSAFLFFGSVLVHELGHALMARARDIEVHGITLFLFGGATHARVESRGPREELIVSAIGPATSLGLAGILWGAGALTRGPLGDALAFLGWINLLLAVFNLLPGFPLDGGRILRSIVWARTGSLPRATRVASIAGQAVGYLLIVTGLVLALAESVTSGIWLGAIGWFLARSARTSYEEMRLLHQLERAPVAEVMTSPPLEPRPDLPKVDAATPVGEILASIEGGEHAEVLVVEDGEVVGRISITVIEDWITERRSVGA